jgi:hypothetical protein
MSQGWIETRIAAVEQRVEWLIRQVQDLIPQLRAAAQQARSAGATYGGSGGGGGGGVFFCLPSSGVSGATGSWPALTPISFTADVYTVAGGTLTLSMASATCWNFFPSPLVASKVVCLAADGTGDFDAITQSCT